jgi:hypothetical protein
VNFVMARWHTEQVTKLEAAERQIKEAIWLFFEKRDYISIHTLAGAANQILYDISEKSGIESLRSSLMVKEEYRKEWINNLNKARNFFKHAKNDPNTLLEFNQELNVFLIVDTLSIYIKVAQKVFPELEVFQIWFTLAYPHLTKEGPLKEVVSNIMVPKGVSAYDYQSCLEVLRDKTKKMR